MGKNDLEFVRSNISKLLKIVDELEENYPGRKFTLDGHLLGSIGEVLAQYYYGVELLPNSTSVHDATKDGKSIQIKITQGNSVDINKIPDYLIVLFLKKNEQKVYEVYNGPGHIVLNGVKKTKSGWYNRSLNKLSTYNKTVKEEELERIELEYGKTIDEWNKTVRN